MKATILVAVLSLSLTPYGLAQSSGDRVALDLGSVTVWLGMPQQEVLSKFEAAGYRVQPVNETTMVLNGERVYDVKFTAGRLSYADRDWIGRDVKAFDAVIGALGALAQYGGSPCRVSHDPIAEPGHSADRIFISCGKRSVLIIKGKLEGNDTVDVYERIGSAS